MHLKIEIEREEDGRWLAEVPELPGVMAYGQTRAEAVAKVEALALRVLADRLEHGWPSPPPSASRCPRHEPVVGDPRRGECSRR